MRLLVCEGQQRCQYGQSDRGSLEIGSGLATSYYCGVLDSPQSRSR